MPSRCCSGWCLPVWCRVGRMGWSDTESIHYDVTRNWNIRWVWPGGPRRITRIQCSNLASNLSNLKFELENRFCGSRPVGWCAHVQATRTFNRIRTSESGRLTATTDIDVGSNLSGHRVYKFELEHPSRVGGPRFVGWCDRHHLSWLKMAVTVT